MTLKWHLTRLHVQQITQTEKYVFHVSMRFQYFEMFRVQYSYAFRSISRSLFCSDRFDSYSFCTALHEGEQSLCMSWLIPTAFLGECWKDRLYYPHGSMQISYIDMPTIAKYATIIIAYHCNGNINSPIYWPTACLLHCRFCLLNQLGCNVLNLRAPCQMSGHIQYLQP